jgi:hypothetical protein
MDFNDAEEAISIYTKETENQIVEFNKLIVALRSRVTYLERELKERDSVPVPKSVIKQILELERDKRKLEDDLTFYKKYVPNTVIINRENSKKPQRSGGLKR